MAIYNIPVPFITNVINFAWNRGLLFYNQAAAKVESREAAKKNPTVITFVKGLTLFKVNYSP